MLYLKVKDRFKLTMTPGDSFRDHNMKLLKRFVLFYFLLA